MRLSSAAAYKDARQVLLKGPNDPPVGHQFFGFADFLRLEPRVTRALVDSSRPSEARLRLFAQVSPFEQLAPVVADSLKLVMQRRIPDPNDLIEICEELGLDAVIEQSKRRGDVEETTDQLFQVAGLLDDYPELRNQLGDRKGRPIAERYELVNKLFGDDLSPAALSLVRRAVTTTAHADPKRNERRSLTSQLRFYQNRLAKSQDTLLATVRCVSPFTETQQERLVKILEKRYGKRVHLHFDIDPEIVGGAQIQIGAAIYDGTIAAALQETKQKLAG